MNGLQGEAAAGAPWKCEGCGWTNVGFVRLCDGCGESKLTAVLSRAQLIADREKASRV